MSEGPLRSAARANARARQQSGIALAVIGGMGIEKPFEIETHRLGPAPAMHSPLDLRAKMEALIVPARDGVSVAGRHLRVDPRDDPRQVARRLRERLIHRMHERRPDADEHTWSSFASIVHGLLLHEVALDAGVERELIETIDGL